MYTNLHIFLIICWFNRQSNSKHMPRQDKTRFILPFIIIVDNCIFITFRRHVWLSSSPFRPTSISIFIPAADTGATRINTSGPEMDY